MRLNVKCQSSKECQISKPPYPSVMSATDIKGQKSLSSFPFKGEVRRGMGFWANAMDD